MYKVRVGTRSEIQLNTQLKCVTKLRIASRKDCNRRFITKRVDYVPGTIKVDGKAVTDAVDQDSGHYTIGKVIGNLGDITDTGWHTVTFQAKVKLDQLDKTIRNIGKITGENITPQEPEKSIVIEPKDPKLETVKEAKELTAR